MKKGKAVRAFSLTELMVVVVVLAILAAFLFPAIGRARHKARGIQCLSNLRQWGAALHLYTVENDDYLPREGKPTPLETDLKNAAYQAWYIELPAQLRLPPYATMPWRTNPAIHPGRTLYLCPCNPRRCNGSSRTNNLFHYCVNDGVDGTGERDRRVQISSVARSSCVIYLFDSKNLPAVGGASFAHTNLHNGGAQFLFLDGHTARWISTAYWDFSRRRARTNNPDLVWSP